MPEPFKNAPTLFLLLLLLGLSACSEDTPTGTGDWTSNLALSPADGAVLTADFDLRIGTSAVDSMVVFFDGERLAVVAERPFTFPFLLAKYEPGEHSLGVTVFAGDAQEQLSADVLMCHGVGHDVGNYAPSYSLDDLDGARHSFRALPDAKLLLLDFWATWCPPCRAALPETQRLYEEYGDRGLKVLTISSEYEEVIRPFISENEYSFPVLLDSDGRAHLVYGVFAIPTYFLIDQRGIVRHVQVGTGGTLLEEIIKELL